MIDWISVKADYIAGRGTNREIAKRYGIHRGTLQTHIAKEGWLQLRKAHRDAVVEKALEQMQEEQANKLARMEQVSGALLDKISLAVSQLDRQVLDRVRKEKEVFYENAQRPDKVTKELLTESEEISEVVSPVDRNGIKLLAAALKDVKEIQMLRDPVDLREQEAKIAKLLKDCREDSDRDTELRVVFEGSTDDCAV